MADKKSITPELLKKISAAAITFLAAHNLSNAQVLITHVNDTVSLSNANPDFINLDLNGDGQNDFKIQIQQNTTILSTLTYYSTVSGSKSYTVINTYTSINYNILALAKKGIKAQNGWLTSNVYVKALESNDLIKGNLLFKNSNKSANLKGIYKKNGSTYSSGGNFASGHDGFIGVKFYSTTNVAHVGWIKIVITGDKSIIIKKMAFEESADSIGVGTKPYYLGVKDTLQDEATIAVKPKFNGKIHFIVLEKTQTPPNWQQVINGTDGNDNAALYSNVEDIITAPDTTLLTVTGLTPNTEYAFYMISEDTAGTVDNDVFSVTFKTKEGTTTGLDANREPILNLYPNPAHDAFVLKGDIQNIRKIEVYGLDGKLIFIKTAPTEKIDISSLKPGVYLVKIYVREHILSQKLIKY